jgi:Fe2+ or Zn2+ uptake regulation protein
MKNIEEIVDKFQEQGYKITPQRRGIFEILVGNESHPRAEDIYDALKERMPDVSLATVYNTLSTLKEMGMVNVLSIVEDDSIRYDPTTDVHDHLFCLDCNSIFDVERDATEMSFPQRKIPGFQLIDRKQVTYYGYCAECQKKRKTD